MHDNGSVQPSAAVRLQLEGQIFEQVEDWRRSQPEIPSRSKAVRLLLGLALTARPNGPRPPEMRRRPSAPLHLTATSTQKLETLPATSPT
jgi:hypothetical protein